MLKIEPTDDERKQDWYVQREGEANYLLGEVRRARNDAEGAASAYRECIKYTTPFAYRARYRLALAAEARGDLDDAKDGLELNLRLLRTADPDPEAEEQSRFALGNIYYKRGNYLQVVEQWRGGRSASRPTPRDAAHYHLADSYRRLADQQLADANAADAAVGQAKREHALKMHRVYLTNARDEFLALAADLDGPDGKGLLTLEEQVQVPFRRRTACSTWATTTRP